ncbi:MAG: aminodeoxychorismate/anthranilate synthase component II [Pirellulaceae bacterium]
MIVLIDNFDSFTYNLVQRLGEIDPTLDLRVFRNNQITCPQIEALGPTHLIVSPGPCTPNEAGISIESIRYFAHKLPVLGVCLGHQSMGQAFGGDIVKAKRLMHGKTDQIYHKGEGLFAGMPNPFVATRYHSLVIDPPSLPPEFQMTAWSDMPSGEREIMAMQHRELPLFGLQFHPESFLSETGTEMLARFLATKPAPDQPAEKVA